MEEINNFQQELDETLYQAWERFKELLMKCPQHYLTEMQEVILFYNGLDVQTRHILDSKVQYHLRLMPIQKLPSKKWLNTLKNGTMEHQGQEDVNNVKGPTTPKIAHSKKKVKPSKKLTTLNLVDLSKEGGGYRAAAPGFYQRNNANPSYQERRQSMEETLSKFMSESAKRHEENSNMIKEIRASTDAAVQNQ
ncbi:hypothetical protein Tco_0860621 [Tanacetum coccineum]|uniref:Retrotransposon gag domain-containing protein n=1 Tax=Tanacetum coccineum TaxID=301880 RepID=A0ABQ5BH73_9ASTR